MTSGDTIEKVYFHIPVTCWYVTQEIKDAIFRDIDHSSPIAKVLPSATASAPYPFLRFGFSEGSGHPPAPLLRLDGTPQSLKSTSNFGPLQ